MKGSTRIEAVTIAHLLNTLEDNLDKIATLLIIIIDTYIVVGFQSFLRPTISWNQLLRNQQIWDVAVGYSGLLGS